MILHLRLFLPDVGACSRILQRPLFLSFPLARHHCASDERIRPELSNATLLSCQHAFDDLASHAGPLLLLSKPTTWLRGEATTVQGDPEAHKGTSNGHWPNQNDCEKIPQRPSSSRQESWVAQDDEGRGCQDLVLLPQD